MEDRVGPNGRVQADGPPAWLVLSLTLGVWLGFVVVEVTQLPRAFRAAVQQGHEYGGPGKLAFAFGNWWCSYWSLVALFALPGVLLAAALYSSLRGRGLRRRASRAWAWLLIAPPAVAALASLAAYCLG